MIIKTIRFSELATFLNVKKARQAILMWSLVGPWLFTNPVNSQFSEKCETAMIVDLDLDQGSGSTLDIIKERINVPCFDGTLVNTPLGGQPKC